MVHVIFCLKSILFQLILLVYYDVAWYFSELQKSGLRMTGFCFHDKIKGIHPVKIFCFTNFLTNFSTITFPHMILSKKDGFYY